MRPEESPTRLRIDPFPDLMTGAVVLSTILHAEARGAEAMSWTGTVGVAGLSFGHGAALAPAAVAAGASHQLLHLFILATTFLVLPAPAYP